MSAFPSLERALCEQPYQAGLFVKNNLQSADLTVTYDNYFVSIYFHAKNFSEIFTTESLLTVILRGQSLEQRPLRTVEK